jgi:hypothetical protein
MSDDVTSVKNPSLSSVGINVWKHTSIWGGIIVMYFFLEHPWNEYFFIVLSIVYALYVIIETAQGKATFLSKLIRKSPPSTDEPEVPADQIQVELVPLTWTEAARIVTSVILLGAALSGISALIRMQVEPEVSSTIRTADIRRRIASLL